MASTTIRSAARSAEMAAVSTAEARVRIVGDPERWCGWLMEP